MSMVGKNQSGFQIMMKKKIIVIEEIIPLILDQGFSRIPVFNEKKDNIKGILYIKDLLPNLKTPNYEWQTLLKPPIYVPENKKLDDLLKEFQQKKNHLAIVVDEYGGTSGLITLEDIMEEIVGDISDEFDEQDLSYSKLDENTFVFEAKISLKDFFRVIGVRVMNTYNREFLKQLKEMLKHWLVFYLK